MKEKLLVLWTKIVENKEVLIKAGATVAGAAIGLTIASMLASAREEMLLEEVDMEQVEDEEE